MNTLNSYLNCSCCIEAQVSPAKDKIFTMNYLEYKEHFNKLLKHLVDNNREFKGNNLVFPIHTHIEKREISKLREEGAKNRILQYYDSLLVNSTPFSQNLNFMLGTRDTNDNYAFMNGVIRECEASGIYVINLSNYGVVFNPEDDFNKKREVLFTLSDIINSINDRHLLPRLASADNPSVYNLIPINIVLSCENLGYDITEDEYYSNIETRIELCKDPVVLTILDLGYDIRLLFKNNISATKDKTVNSSIVVDDNEYLDKVMSQLK